MLSYGLPSLGRKRGGIEQVAHDLADGLARRGHSVTVWTYDDQPAGAAYEVRRLPGQAFATSWLGRRLTMGYLGNFLPLILDARHYDVLIVHGDSLLLPLLSKPAIRVVHGSALGEAWSARSPWRCVLQLGVYAQELLSSCVHEETVAVSKNCARQNPFLRRVIANGVDLSRFCPEAERNTEPTVLFVGALTGRKRGALLLEWFTRWVRPRFPEARLEMVCTPGPALPGVRYHTGVAPSDLVRLYREAWVYASPSCYEGFGLPYVEAMACGTPVLASPNPGSREILDDGRYGMLADDRHFPEELCALLGDPKRRETYAALGLKRAQAYSIDTMLDGYENLLRHVCRRGRQRQAHVRR